MSFFSKEQFAQRLCAIKEEQGLSLKDMAAKAGIKKPQTLRNYLEGAALPNVQTVAAFSLNLGVDPGWLLTGEGEMYAPRGPDAYFDPADAEFNSDLVSTADALRDFFEGEVEADLDEVAKVGGMNRACLDACLGARLQPPALALARWVVRYGLNANFALAQIGQPTVDGDIFSQGGPLSEVAQRRWAKETASLEAGDVSPAFAGVLPGKDKEDAQGPAQGEEGGKSELGRELEDVRREFERANAPEELVHQAMLEAIKSRRSPASEEAGPARKVGTSSGRKTNEYQGPRRAKGLGS